LSRKATAISASEDVILRAEIMTFEISDFDSCKSLQRNERAFQNHDFGSKIMSKSRKNLQNHAKSRQNHWRNHVGINQGKDGSVEF
jgi:hypothetical protein